jgi:hypothetical protein
MDLLAIMPAAVGPSLVGNFVRLKIMVVRLSVGLVFILHAISVAMGARGRCDRRHLNLLENKVNEVPVSIKRWFQAQLCHSNGAAADDDD